MVNDSIANEVQKIHKLKEKPVVVRNIPRYWDTDNDVCEKTKKELLGSLYNQGIFVLMYHGGIVRGRGIETLLEAVAKTEKTVAVILGNGEISYVEQLKGIAQQLQISQRVIFHPAVEIDILWQYVGAADVGMITIPAITQSYYFMLPNKFFENIQAETPLIASNFPEIAKIINEYDIGLLVDPKNVDEIVEAIEKMRTNKKLYNKFKSNLKRAKEELCWENERKALEKAYAKILS
jgi:glycosyltransferase involved in cell wall biosynthesis